ncbi:alpha/beta fold hydrolase [Siccirubricoccus phaeus]|uniref:alpha/beta fold hydrolase n=1 Tax=Siccirubricoccus phaeus TaxID=2595053 RepID=UPI0011F0BC99|nr:alpha/beta hydrolase [Siccirubricoccus phaeus]
MQNRREVMASGLAGLAAGGAPGLLHPAQAQAPAAAEFGYRRHMVRTPDGLDIAAYEYGNPEGQPILLIHGYQQAALSWARQTGDPALAREFRLVAYDIRGHGMSAKPEDDRYYKPGQVWADEVKAVIDQLRLARPVLVGWSYGGRIMGDYLNAHGHAAIGGMNWVAATSSVADTARFGRALRWIAPATGGSPDPATAIAATIAFLHACFEQAPGAADFQTMLAFNMMVPRHVRLGLGGRPLEIEARLQALDIPVLVTHGLHDRVSDVSMGRYTASVVPNARLSVYDDAGHSPFWEDTPRFNRELAELARSVRRA